MGGKSPIETIVNGILHKAYGKSLFHPLADTLFPRFLDGAWTNKAALGRMGIFRHYQSIDTKFKGFRDY